MNFFESQHQARKATFRLVLLFILAIALIILAVDVLFLGAFLYANQHENLMVIHKGDHLDYDKLRTLFFQITIMVSPIIIAVILIGTLFKLLALREGGIALAKMVDATPIDPSTNDPNLKRFINVVEEMSIAAGVAIPKLYVMENEPAINAFVAGFKPQDTVMVVTQGALDNLSREELQGVVGHEFSHIFNSDMQISLRLVGILAGLLIIGQAGFFIFRFTGSGRSKKDNQLQIAIFLFGLGLFILGYIGLFFGRLIKAGISRQRETLADASSVAYTRYPEGLISALKRIQQHEQGSVLASKKAEDISHLCFSPSLNVFMSSLLATHPPLEKRIKMLDPEGRYQDAGLKTKPPLDTHPKSEPKTTKELFGVLATGGMALGMSNQTNTNIIENSIGNPTQDHIDYAKQLISLIPDNLKELTHSPDQIEFLLYGLSISTLDNKTKDVEENLKNNLIENDIKSVFSIAEQLKQLPKGIRLPIIDLSLPTFQMLEKSQREKIYQNMKNLILLNPENLFEFMLLSIIEKRVDPNLKLKKPLINDFKPVLNEISTLMALVIKQSGTDITNQQPTFNKIMKLFTQDIPPNPLVGKAEQVKIQVILSRLNQLNPKLKQQLIKACLQCIEEENIINIDEAELVRCIAARLDCPIPPILPTSTL